MGLPEPYYDKGGITIYCGDNRDILPFLPKESVNLLWTDPPYGHANQDGDLQSARVGILGARQRESVTIANDGMDEMREVVNDALNLAVPLLFRDSCCCCCCCGGGGPKPTFAWLANRMDSDGLSFFHACIWDKTMRGPGMGWRFRRDYEMVLCAHRSGGKFSWHGDKAISNIHRIAPPRNLLHPTTKPVELPGVYVRNCTQPGELVLDPFMGSGTTLVAAKQLGRKAIGIEISEAYCKIAVERLAQDVLDFGGHE